MKGKVCQFTIIHRLEDERIFHKECMSLSKQHDVTLVSTSEISSERNGINVVGIGYPKSSFERFRKIFSIIPLLLRQKADVYHFHDPELIFTGFILKKIFGKKVVYDVHEYYTEKLQGRNFRRLSSIKKPLIKTWSWLEKWIANQLDLTVSADPVTAQQFTKTKSIVIGNFPPLSFVNGSQPKTGKQEDDDFRVVYVGTIHEHRGLRKAVEAIQKVKYPNVKLHIIGESRYPELTQLFQSSPRVVYHGRIPWEKLNIELKKCSVGLALLQPTPSFIYCPGENIVKLFEYAGMGIPYLISNFPRLTNFVNEHGGGLLVDPTNTDDIARAIERLYEDKVLYQNLSAEGIAMVKNKFNWDLQEKKLLNAYDEILS